MKPLTKERVIAFANHFHKEKVKLQRTGQMSNGSIQNPQEMFDEFFAPELCPEPKLWSKNCHNCKFLNSETYKCSSCDDFHCMFEPAKSEGLDTRSYLMGYADAKEQTAKSDKKSAEDNMIDLIRIARKGSEIWKQGGMALWKFDIDSEKDVLKEYLSTHEPTEPTEPTLSLPTDEEKPICGLTTSCGNQEWRPIETEPLWRRYRCNSCGGTKTVFRNQYPGYQDGD
jgi:hypothetical protein